MFLALMLVLAVGALFALPFVMLHVEERLYAAMPQRSAGPTALPGESSLGSGAAPQAHRTAA